MLLPNSVLEQMVVDRTRPVIFLFPGQGAQTVNMARELYAHEPCFQRECDRGFAILQTYLELDLKAILYPSDHSDGGELAQVLKQTKMTQPALFIVEYALAQLWMSWGVKPTALLGHSVGEYVAACLAGIFSFEDALLLVAARGALMQSCPPGSMLSVYLPASELKTRLRSGSLSVAVSNGPKLTVVAGPTEDIEQFEADLQRQEIFCRRLHTSHAFHSDMMASALAPFAQKVEAVVRRSPRIPIISNRTGQPLSAEDARSVDYWVEHLRQAVCFSEGVTTVLDKHPTSIFLEVGPGRVLSSLVKQHDMKAIALQSLPHPKEEVSQYQRLLKTVERLRSEGIAVSCPKDYTLNAQETIALG